MSELNFMGTSTPASQFGPEQEHSKDIHVTKGKLGLISGYVSLLAMCRILKISKRSSHSLPLLRFHRPPLCLTSRQCPPLQQHDHSWRYCRRAPPRPLSSPSSSSSRPCHIEQLPAIHAPLSPVRAQRLIDRASWLLTNLCARRCRSSSSRDLHPILILQPRASI